MASPWIYYLKQEVREKLRRLCLARYERELPPTLDGDTVHLTTLFHLIQYFWHTINDEFPVPPATEHTIKEIESDIRRRGDAIVQEHLSEGNVWEKDHVLYMLVRNLRTKVNMPGVPGSWVLFSINNSETDIRIGFQPAIQQQDVLTENVPWMHVQLYLSRIQFALDQSEDFGHLEEQLGFKPFKGSVTSAFIPFVNDQDLDMFYDIWP